MAKRKNHSISRALEKEMLELFFQVTGDMRDKTETKIFFLDFLTDNERQTLSRRLYVASMLQNGDSYQDIKHKLKVSSATISSVAETIHSRGIKLALEKIATESWADKWATKVLQLLGFKI